MKIMSMFFLVLAVTLLTMAQVPQWYTSHVHPKYSPNEYIVGVGSGNGSTGAEAAKKSALSDIVSQLRVQVQSEMKSVTESYAVNDDEQMYSDFKRQSRTMVNDEITGADVVETVTDNSTGTAYALVVLDRDKYSAGLKTELESGWKQASDFRTAAGEYFSLGKLNEAIQSLLQIKTVIAPLLAKQVLHNAAARSPFSFALSFNPAAIQSDIRSYLSQIKIEKRGGDAQQGKIGERFPQPLVAGVTANGKPIVGVMVSYFLDGKVLLGEERTDEKGSASLTTFIRNGNSIKAKLSLPGIGREFDQNLDASSVNFTWSAKASEKAFSISVNSKNKKVAEILQSKISTSVAQIGYKIVTMSNHTIVVEVSSGVPNKIEGMAGTLYNLTLEASVNVKDTKSNSVIGSETFSAKGVGKSEDEAMEKAAAGFKVDQKVLSELLQK